MEKSLVKWVHTGLLGLALAKASCVDPFNSFFNFASAPVELLRREADSEVGTCKKYHKFDDNDKHPQMVDGMVDMLRHARYNYNI